MRALVISGGGSKGAFGGGVADYLISKAGIEYDIFVGTSTGSLLVPLLSIGEVEKIKYAYTHVRQKDVFNISPFTIKRNGEEITQVGINHLNILKMFMKGKNTFGESKNLRKLIANTISPKDFERIKHSGKQVIVTVSNLSRNVVEYKYAFDNSYEDFLDWIWVSSNLVPFMSLVEKNGFEYADGGFGNVIPIQEAINLGATKIDVIVLNPRIREVRKPKSTNPFSVLTSSIDFMITQIAQDDIFIGLLESRYTDVEVRFFHTPRKLTDNSFVFQPKEMCAWWEEGYEYASKMVPDYV